MEIKLEKVKVVLYPRTKKDQNLFLEGVSTGATAALTESVALWAVHSLELCF